MSHLSYVFECLSENASQRGAAQTTRTTATISDWLQLVRAEYLEIPGLHLTRSQMQRLWGLDPTTRDELLDALVDARFLKQTRDGGYVRADADDR
jgi:hypothetical protein